MIVSKADTGHLVIGLNEADIVEMRKGLTKVKQGGPDWGFPSMIVFLGKSDQENMQLLSSYMGSNTKRSDDMFPNAGGG